MPQLSWSASMRVKIKNIPFMTFYSPAKNRNIWDIFNIIRNLCWYDIKINCSLFVKYYIDNYGFPGRQMQAGLTVKCHSSTEKFHWLSKWCCHGQGEYKTGLSKEGLLRKHVSSHYGFSKSSWAHIKNCVVLTLS